MFITFEGIEGSGKTTQMVNIRRYLESHGKTCVTTREPGDTRIGAQIRKILLDPENRDLVPQAELFLYAADRAQHIRERILPALEAGHVVICDRFFDATTVYQGYARGLDLDLINDIHKRVLGNLKPDITFLFDLDPDVGLKRAWAAIDGGGRSSDETRFEQETLAFHEKVRNGYLDIAQKEPERIVLLDASISQDEVFEQIRRTLALRFSFHSL
jgi:dTMP kinase